MRFSPRRLAENAVGLFLPVAAVMIVWRAAGPDLDPGCLSSPFSMLGPEGFSAALSKDWKGLMSRFEGKVGGHAWRSKTPALLVAALGRVLMIRDGRIRGLSVLTVAAAIYFGALYWLHQTCFGPYYFENLNSIPRFSRVIVQPVHALWLLAVRTWLIGCSADCPLSSRR